MMVEDELPFPKIINKNNLFMDTSNITNFDYFCQLYKIEEFTPEIDYSAALTMNSAFSGCSHLKRIHRINSMNCKNFNECFLRCNKLKELVIDTDCGENYNQMLRACTELENIKFTHLTKGKNFYSMFEYCSLLKTIDLKGETINGTCFDTMFASCSSLQEVVGLDVQSAVPGSYSQSESPSLRGIFYKCSSLKKLDIRNVKKSLDLRDCPLLTEESILNISKELHTVPDDFKGHDKINIYFNDNNRIKNYLNNTYCRIINSTDSKKPIELVEKDTDSAISLADYIKNEGKEQIQWRCVSLFSKKSTIRKHSRRAVRKNTYLWVHVIVVQIYSRSRRHSQCSLEDPVQNAISYATYLYDYESLFSNRNHNPLSKPNR